MAGVYEFSLSYNYNSICWRDEYLCDRRGEYVGRRVGALFPRYLAGMVGYGISAAWRVCQVALRAIILLQSVACTISFFGLGKEQTKDAAKLFGASFLQLGSALVGCVCPPAAYKIDEWIHKREEGNWHELVNTHELVGLFGDPLGWIQSQRVLLAEEISRMFEGENPTLEIRFQQVVQALCNEFDRCYSQQKNSASEAKQEAIADESFGYMQGGDESAKNALTALAVHLLLDDLVAGCRFEYRGEGEDTRYFVTDPARSYFCALEQGFYPNGGAGDRIDLMKAAFFAQQQLQNSLPEGGEIDQDLVSAQKANAIKHYSYNLSREDEEENLPIITRGPAEEYRQFTKIYEPLSIWAGSITGGQHPAGPLKTLRDQIIFRNM